MMNRKTTTYSLDWDTIVNLESRLFKDFTATKNENKARELLMISIGARLGLRVIDNLSLKYSDLAHLEIGERFIRIEKKTKKERILVMSKKLKEIIDVVLSLLNPNLDHFIFTSQKGKGWSPMAIQTFNVILKGIIKEYKIKTIGNTSSHLLRKSFVVSAIKRGFEKGDHLSLVKVSRLIGHNSVSTTLRYTNFETNAMLDLYDLS